MGNESNHLSDKVIVTNILNGNIQDFAVVVKNTEKLIAQIVRKMTANEDDQKDLVQEIYLKAYQNLSSFQYKSKLSTWIATIAYNTSVNYLKKKRIKLYDMDFLSENKYGEYETIEDKIYKKENAQFINNELNKLPHLFKTLISLYHLEELPIKEISEITNLPEGTIKSYLSRARKTLKDSINHHFKNEYYEK